MAAPIEITATIVGVERVERKFALDAPREVRVRVGKTVRGLGLLLERNVKTRSLAGLVLNRRTGRAARSVNTKFTSNDTLFESTTGSNLIYLRAWELGFRVPAREIVPRNAQALMWPGAAHPVRKVYQKPRTQAARPWLRPELTQMAPTINKSLTLALRGL